MSRASHHRAHGGPPPSAFWPSCRGGRRRRAATSTHRAQPRPALGIAGRPAGLAPGAGLPHQPPAHRPAPVRASRHPPRRHRSRRDDRRRCAARRNFRARRSRPLPAAAAPRRSRTLAQLGYPAARWPAVAMLDTAADQAACRRRAGRARVCGDGEEGAMRPASRRPRSPPRSPWAARGGPGGLRVLDDPGTGTATAGAASPQPVTIAPGTAPTAGALPDRDATGDVAVAITNPNPTRARGALVLDTGGGRRRVLGQCRRLRPPFRARRVRLGHPGRRDGAGSTCATR